MLHASRGDEMPGWYHESLGDRHRRRRPRGGGRGATRLKAAFPEPDVDFFDYFFGKAAMREASQPDAEPFRQGDLFALLVYRHDDDRVSRRVERREVAGELARRYGFPVLSRDAA